MDNKGLDQELFNKAVADEVNRLLVEKEQREKEEQVKEEMKQQFINQTEAEIRSLLIKKTESEKKMKKNMTNIITSSLFIILFWGTIFFAIYKIGGDVAYLQDKEVIGEMVLFAIEVAGILICVLIGLGALSIIGLIPGIVVGLLWAEWFESWNITYDQGILIGLGFTAIMLLRLIINILGRSGNKKEYYKIKFEIDKLVNLIH